MRLPTLIDGIELRFRTVEGHDLLQAVRGGHATTLGERVDGAADDDLWSRHLGEWVPVHERSEDALRVTAARVVDHEDHLELEVDLERPTGTSTLALVLLPIDASRARIAGIGRSKGDVVHVEDGRLHVLGVELQR